MGSRGGTSGGHHAYFLANPRHGKIWMADDWDSDETNLAIQKMFEGDDDDLVYPEKKPV